MLDKVSIIIPCYNAEKTLNRCLDSIFTQKCAMLEIEVICVNDSSTDGTLTILMQYEKMHSEKMVVITLEENGKQGRARNIALNYATGNYIMYMDADDIVAESIVERLYTIIKKYDCDIVGCGYKSFSKLSEISIHEEGKKEEIFDMKNLSWKKACILRHFPQTAPWGRIYRRAVLERENVFFAENITMEDIFFSEIVMAQTEKYVWIPDKLYFYYINPNGTYYNRNIADYYMDSMIVQNAATDVIVKKGWLDGCEKELGYLHFLKAFCEPIVRMVKDKNCYSYENYRLAYEELISRYPYIYDNDYIKQSEAANVMLAHELCKRLLTQEEFSQVLHIGN